MNFDRDGEFFMAFDDFVTRFSDVDICHLTSGTTILKLFCLARIVL